MLDWLTDNKIPLGKWIKSFVDFLLDNFAWFFDQFSEGLEFLIEGFVDGMLWLHPLVMIGIFAVIAWLLHRSWKMVVLIVLSLLLVINLGYWEETLQTLGLVIFSTLVCIVVGCTDRNRSGPSAMAVYGFAADPGSDADHPDVVYLIPTMIMFGLGVVPGLISTVIFAIPAPIRLTYLGVSGVPTALREAG